MDTGFAPQLGRLDRYVKRSHVRMNAGVSQHRVAWSLEEALRLAHLPGEEEGRVYCFRRVSLTGIPAEDMRPVWMEKVQQSLTALARRSVHGGEPGAVGADAVYFNSLEEALETLLREALCRTIDEPAPPPWFATSLLGVAPQKNYAALVPVILDRLHSSLMPGASAAILFAALGDSDPAALLASIPEDAIRAWLRAFDEPKTAAEMPPMELPQVITTALRRSAAQFGWRSPALLWFATQAVLSVSPGAWVHGLAVKKARATLRLLEPSGDNGLRDHNLLANQNNRMRIHGLDDEHRDSGTLPAPASFNAPPEIGHSRFMPRANTAFVVQPNQQSLADPQTANPAISLVESKIAYPALLGESTDSAGLLFLLNVLRRIGITAALQSHPVLADASLPAHVLKRLAVEAGVAEDDPILLCLTGADGPFILPSEAIDNILSLDAAWPIGFAPQPLTPRTSSHFLRAWCLATRLWCWRQTHLSIREIIHRRGRISGSRTDIDVVLPLDQADVRIRRAGLDIDPLWLPWFGLYGKVVRFHYRDREPENMA